ncbi:MAG: uracil-DNA glycosylase [Cardiobacteriaceae bacterium]|nr:uracil-DNA glycosylase [Cardiobacteriaceae bacterium]
MTCEITINPNDVQIENTWKTALYKEFSKPYFARIKQILMDAKDANIPVYPPGKLIFNAFNRTPFNRVRVVILGQDPYHQPGQAMGLSFSVPQGARIPPSLQNIYKELERSIEGFVRPNHGDLSHWADQGVLLLNASLTVERSKAGSHSRIGWQLFTDAVIETLSKERSDLIFMLWGNFAKEKVRLIDADKHYILTAVHPSPLAGNGFVGCSHFASANQILQARGEPPIDWRL